ncbi:MAG TPA: metalloregulator ArsR/SmtB family transcription factor [Rhizomicrobium sp.]
MSDVFDALAHPVRRKILKLLRKRAMSAGELAQKFDLAKPTLSGHFAMLKAAALVTAERRGTTILYRLNMSMLEEAAASLLDLAGVRRGKVEDHERAISADPVGRADRRDAGRGRKGVARPASGRADRGALER